MLKIYLIIPVILLFISACSKKQDKPDAQEANQTFTVTTMQDIADDIEYIYEDEIVYDYKSEYQAKAVDKTPVKEDVKTTQVKETKPVNPKPSQQATRTQATQTKEPEIEYGDFTVQLISLKDKSKVENIRRKLSSSSANKGTYFTDIHESEVNGETVYRLRLSGSYSRNYAKYLGEKIKSEFSEITDIWVVRK